jgi:hypothetical protein
VIKYSLLAILLLAPIPFLAADDGSWSDSRGYTPAEGALYSEEGNPDVALEKEYLELGDYKTGSTRAVFQFRNTAKKDLVVECAFPVRIEWSVHPVKFDQAGNITEESGPDVLRAWGWGFGADSGYPAQAKGPFSATLLDWLAAFGIRSYGWKSDQAEGPELSGTYIAEADYPRGRVDFEPDAFTICPVAIRQDGRPVEISACVVDFGDKPGRITLHFRHRLSFPANSASKVEVSYSFPGGSMASGYPSLPGYYNAYDWKYVLETGASWKGPIGSLVLALPPDFSGTLPEPLKLVGAARGRLLFEADAWEPAKDQNLSLSWSEQVLRPGFGDGLWLSEPRELELADVAQPAAGVADIRASSFLPDKADVFVSRGVIRKAPFDGERLFDGLRETCWVEGKADDGIGEYVAFTLGRPVCLVAVQNGFLRSPIDIPEKATWSYFGKNNRVKGLEIQTDKGAKVAALALADSRELQYFAVDLQPGRYRAVIASVYRGSTWRDSCLGELIFYPGTVGGAAALDSLAKDPFFGALVGH